jgi:hypothetical protein
MLTVEHCLTAPARAEVLLQVSWIVARKKLLEKLGKYTLS